MSLFLLWSLSVESSDQLPQPKAAVSVCFQHSEDDWLIFGVSIVPAFIDNVPHGFCKSDCALPVNRQKNPKKGRSIVLMVTRGLCCLHSRVTKPT